MTRDADTREFVNGYEIIVCECWKCGFPMRVVKDSVPDRERLCNHCAIAEQYRYLYGTD